MSRSIFIITLNGRAATHADLYPPNSMTWQEGDQRSKEGLQTYIAGPTRKACIAAYMEEYPLPYNRSDRDGTWKTRAPGVDVQRLEWPYMHHDARGLK